MTYFYRLLAIVAMVLTANHAATAENALTKNPNGILAVKFLDMAFNHHKVADAFAEYVGPTYRQHNPMVKDGKEAAITALSGWVQHMPGAQVEIKRVFVDRDTVALHCHYRANKEDRGMAVVDMFRFEKGKIVEHWDVVQPIPEQAANDNTMF